jgi:hypothetical protein
LRKARGGIVLVYRIGMFSNHIDKLLTQLWIWRVCLLRKGGQSKVDCQTYKSNC